MSRDLVSVYRENESFIRENRYVLGGCTVAFEHSPAEHRSVEVYSPYRLSNLVAGILIDHEREDEPSLRERLEFAEADSLWAPRDLVLNFANAVNPGGGYEYGARAQEEALCRQSTLFASISSGRAQEMYQYNRKVRNFFDSDYLLISPCVEVFRGRDLQLLEKPFTTAVVTIPAPDNNRRPAGVTDEEVSRIFHTRIRNMLCCAIESGYKTLSLGAWGCGVFRNPSEMVAGAFRDVLLVEGLIRYFDLISFAIPDRAKLEIFRKVMMQ